MQPSVTSEIGRLRQVIIHRPGREMLRLTPSNMEHLLFDDMLWLEHAQAEHDDFANSLRAQGTEVLYFQDLLAEAMDIPEARKHVLTSVFTEESHGGAIADAMRSYGESLTGAQLAELLIAGMTKEEFAETVPASISSVVYDAMGPTSFVVAPLPNHLFTRDTSCWVYDGVSINSMRKEARRRETINYEAIYHFLPRFKDPSIKKWCNGIEAGPATVEGGDVLVIGNGAVLVGMSERTTPQGVERMARRLFANSEVHQVIALDMAKERAQMHLDTVMTMADYGTFTKYAGMGMVESMTLTSNGEGGVNVEAHDPEDMHKVIGRALGLDDIKVLTPPMDALAAEREQWNDGSNVLAGAPGVVYAYERNTVTNDFLTEHGITVITVPGDELGRGRGGPRCMSCPVVREAV